MTSFTFPTHNLLLHKYPKRPTLTPIRDLFRSRQKLWCNLPFPTPIHELYKLVLSEFVPQAQITPEFKKLLKTQMERIFEQKRSYRSSQLRLMASGHEASERLVYDDMVKFFSDHNVSAILVV